MDGQGIFSGIDTEQMTTPLVLLGHASHPHTAIIICKNLNTV
jgi:hypothetical protein